MSRKSDTLESTLMKAETNQLESFIRSRSQFLDLEIERMRNKLHQPSTKASTSIDDSSHDESRRHSSDSRGQHSDKKLDNSIMAASMTERSLDRSSRNTNLRPEGHSNSELLNRSAGSYMTNQRNSSEVHVSPTGRNLTATGQGIQLLSKERTLPNRNYSPNRRPDNTMDASSLSNIRNSNHNQNNNQNNRSSTNYSAFQKGKNVLDYASKGRIRVEKGHRNENERRRDQVDYSDDSDLSDNPSTSTNRNAHRSGSNNRRGNDHEVEEQGEVQKEEELAKNNNLKIKDMVNRRDIKAHILTITTPNNNSSHRSKSLPTASENNENNKNSNMSKSNENSHQFLADISPNMRNLFERINQGKRLLIFIFLRNV